MLWLGKKRKLGHLFGDMPWVVFIGRCRRQRCRRQHSARVDRTEEDDTGQVAREQDRQNYCAHLEQYLSSAQWKK